MSPCWLKTYKRTENPKQENEYEKGKEKEKKNIAAVAATTTAEEPND